ncbi:MAG: hypothetical protein H7257_00070 [Taibaiella sp.]|nr:hypothetical protein [Taibaiella sp.]
MSKTLPSGLGAGGLKTNLWRRGSKWASGKVLLRASASLSDRAWASFSDRASASLSDRAENCEE